MADLTAYPPTLRFPIPVPTRRLIIAGVIGAVVPFGVETLYPGWGVVSLAALWAVILIIWAVDVLLAPSPRHLVYRRRVSSPAVLGGQASVEWTVGNPTRRTVTLRLSDSPSPSLCAEAPVGNLRIPAGEEGAFTYAFFPVRRGHIPILPPVIRTLGPLGLGMKQVGVDYQAEVAVNPAFPSRKVAELRLDDLKRLFIGQRAVRQRGESGDFDYLREYVPGDEIRHINWAATARSQQLIVEQTRAERNQQIVVLIDHSRLSVPTVRRFTPPPEVYDGLVVDLDVVKRERAELDNAPRLDHVLDAVMALSYVATGLGDRIGLISYGATFTGALAPDSGRDHRAAVNRFLSGLYPTWDEPDAVDAVNWLMTHWKRRSLVIVATDLNAESVNLTLIPALKRLVSRHQVVVASLLDPTVAMWATATPLDEAGALRQVAARRHIERRKETAAMITRLGVQVLDVPGNRLSSQLIDLYVNADDLTTSSQVYRRTQRGE